MRFETNESLLKELAWPEHAMDRRGAMTWATILRDERDQAVKATASVVVEDTTVTLRLDAGTGGGENRSLLEATWKLDGPDGPALTFATRAGSPAALDEARIVTEFQNRVNEMGILPHFQPMAPRNSSGSPKRGPGL